MLRLIQEGSMNDMMGMMAGSAMQGLSILGSLFLFVIGVIVAASIVLFFIDVTQTEDAVRRNYPVIGRFPLRIHQSSDVGRIDICQWHVPKAGG